MDYYLRPFSSFLGAHLLVHLERKGHALQLPSHLAKYAQVPLRWALQSEDVLGV